MLESLFYCFFFSDLKIGLFNFIIKLRNDCIFFTDEDCHVFSVGDSVIQLYGASHSARGEEKGPAHVQRKIQELFDK